MKSSFWKYQLKYWLPVYIYLILIFIISSQPSGDIGDYVHKTFFLGQALQHLGAYTLLGLLLYRALEHTKSTSKLLVILITTLYGLLIEINQHFTPGRSFELMDILMNFLGAVLSLVLISAYRMFKK